MVAAPAELKLAGFKVIDATPEAFVRAVPPAGVMVAKVASVVKVTTVLGTATPFATMSIALTVAGARLEIEVVAVPELLTIERVSDGAGTIVVPAGVNVVVVVAGVVEVGVGEPLPHPAMRIVVATVKANKPVCFKKVDIKTAPSLKN